MTFGWSPKILRFNIPIGNNQWSSRSLAHSAAIVNKSNFFFKFQITALWPKLIISFFNFFCWSAPFGYLYFLYFQMNQNWIQISILAWLWHHFHHLVYWMRQDSNPQPIDRESNLLTIRPDWRPYKFYWSCLKLVYAHYKGGQNWLENKHLTYLI